MKRSTVLVVLVTVIGTLAFLAAGCGGSGESTATGAAGGTSGGSTGNIEELPASSCGPLEYKGSGDAQALLVSDLPLQGGSRTQTLQMNEAIRYVLDQAAPAFPNADRLTAPCERASRHRPDDGVEARTVSASG